MVEVFLYLDHRELWLNWSIACLFVLDDAEERQIEELKQAAHKELDDWYKHREEQLEKTKSTNRLVRIQLSAITR